MHVVCRPMTLSDLANVVALDHRCFGGLWNEAAYSREVHSPNSDLLVVETPAQGTRQKMIGIGCLWAILDEAHITLLGIEPQYQRLGLGRWLLIHLLRAAGDRGLTHATLEVRQSNQVALALYQSLGFQVAGERRRYYADDENALILWCSHLQDSSFLSELQAQQQQLNQKLQATTAPAASPTTS
ncbi:ribosomal-protein-alanine N-acetyltransferase [Leptolyngbya iicbica LK]|uniref:Ribosomal-protein-alanine N-acetyltransferase n=3 Tax=Cyanophyceae TaxID=3028117 RepID=A0A4Q7E3T4_9CYAN|nr:ribosomal-protein-alanine N-acetyltransferase [Leptolyngbya sp. LK]